MASPVPVIVICAGLITLCVVPCSLPFFGKAALPERLPITFCATLPATVVRALLALPQRPTCIIFPDDFSALGGYNALSEAGLSIPEDISVMGYDGIYLSRVVKPSLVTYQQNTKSLGRLAADKLIELIEHPRVTLPEQIRVSGKLLDGGSVRIL